MTSRRTSASAKEGAKAISKEPEIVKEEKPIAVQFQVHMKSDLTLKTYPFETPGNQNRVYLVGDHPLLGDWTPADAIPMIRSAHATSTKDVAVTWRADTILPGPIRLQYRYFIGRPSPTVDGRVIIIKWEAFPEPRSQQIKRLTKAEEKVGLVFIHDTFGQYGTSSQMDGGWLTTQLEVRLSFLKNPIRWWRKRHQVLKYSMKVAATDPELAETAAQSSPSMTSLNDHALMHEEHAGTLGPVTYAVLNDDPNKEKDRESRKQRNESDIPKTRGYQLQGQFGVELFTDENIIFRVQSEDPKNLYFTIDFFALDHHKAEENAPYFAGTSHILFSNFDSEDNLITAPIFGRCSSPIGAVTFKYLVIRPLQNTVLRMARSRFHHYSVGRKTMDIGHRGMGHSYGVHAQKYRENTIESFSMAGHCGADLVECDVQLTKDAVPIIYHDFNLKVNLRKRVLDNMNDSKDSNFELNTVAVKDLTLKQLQSLQTYHESVEEFGPRDWRTDTTAANADEPEESLPFPTLEKLLYSLDRRVGINLEIKYPQLINHGDGNLEHESENFFDRNNFLDIILENLLEHSGDRQIIISCFDSEACIMLKKKQCLFPVIFLTQGQTMKYPPFKDFRTLSIHAAIKFARAEQLVGINVNSEDLLRDPSVISEVKHAGLALFCWGDENDKPDNAQYLKSQGVDGIVTNEVEAIVHPEKAALAAATSQGMPPPKNHRSGSNATSRLKSNAPPTDSPSGKASMRGSFAAKGSVQAGGRGGSGDRSRNELGSMRMVDELTKHPVNNHGTDHSIPQSLAPKLPQPQSRPSFASRNRASSGGVVRLSPTRLKNK